MTAAARALPLRAAASTVADAPADRVPRWLRAVAAAMVRLLRVPVVMPVAAWMLERVFARLPFMDFLAAPDALGTPGRRAAFTASLLREMARKLGRGEVSPAYLTGWVSVLLDAALFGPRARRAAARRLGCEPPAFLVASPGSACNLRCSHCYAARPDAPRRTLPFESVDAVVAQLRERWGAALVIVSGGEPLLWRDGGAGLLELAARRPRTLFIVYSNATLVDPRVAARIAALGNVLPLLSLEGDEARTDAVRGAGTHAAVLRAMRHLRDAGALFGVSLTAGAANAHALGSPAFLRRLADEHGASFFWVLEHAAVGRAHESGGLSAPARDELQRALNEASAAGRLVASFLHTPLARSGCCGARRFDGFLHVDWNGDVQRCVYQPAPLANVLPHLRDGSGLDGLLAGCPALRRPCPMAPRAD